MVLKLGKDDRLSGLVPRENLLVFSVGSTPGLDASRNGLTSGGQEVLARTSFAVLRQYRDRIRRPTASAAPVSPVVEKASGPGRRQKRGGGRKK